MASDSSIAQPPSPLRGPRLWILLLLAAALLDFPPPVAPPGTLSHRRVIYPSIRLTFQLGKRTYGLEEFQIRRTTTTGDILPGPITSCTYLYWGERDVDPWILLPLTDPLQTEDRGGGDRYFWYRGPAWPILLGLFLALALPLLIVLRRPISRAFGRRKEVAPR